MSDTRTGASLAARTEDMKRTVTTLVEAMELRKWAVRRAIQALASSQFGTVDDIVNTHAQLAERIHTFVATPALEAVAAIEAVKHRP